MLEQDEKLCAVQDMNLCAEQDTNLCAEQDSNLCVEQNSNLCAMQDTNLCAMQDTNLCAEQDTNLPIVLLLVPSTQLGCSECGSFKKERMVLEKNIIPTNQFFKGLKLEESRSWI